MASLDDAPGKPDPWRRTGGLTSEEAKRRLVRDGRNEIDREEARSPWGLLAGQVKSPVIWLLLGACVISAGLGELVDSIAIGTIVALNALVGFFQGGGCHDRRRRE